MIQKIVHTFLICVFLTFLQGCTLFGGVQDDDYDEDYDGEEYDEGEEFDEEDEEDYETVEEDPESDVEDEEKDEEESEEDDEDVYYIDEEDEEDGLYGDEDIEVEEDEEESFGDSDEEDYDYSEGDQTDTSGTGTAGEAITSMPGLGIPLRKIRTTPYNRGGYLANAVYIARPDEDLTAISQKIFNSTEQTEQLRALNPHLSGREVTVGDKVYYQSPNRAQDASNLLFYYQDIGASPEYYTLQPGDDIRKVSYRLLGHPKSWKEIWATNPDIVSKGSVAGSISIQYWPDGVSAGVPPSPSQEEYAEQPAPPMEEDPVGSDLADSDFPPSEPPLGQEDDSTDDPPLPGEPPIPDDMEGAAEGKGDFFKNLTSRTELLVAGALALLGILGVVAVVRKRKKKEFDFTAGGFQMTNIDEDEEDQ